MGSADFNLGPKTTPKGHHKIRSDVWLRLILGGLCLLVAVALVWRAS